MERDLLIRGRTAVETVRVLFRQECAGARATRLARPASLSRFERPGVRNRQAGLAAVEPRDRRLFGKYRRRGNLADAAVRVPAVRRRALVAVSSQRRDS